jgi:predicted O-linked N-acetylglucosamine transferase (SPINDLY family)
MLIKAGLLAHDEAVRRLLDRFRRAGIGADRLELRGWESERTRHLEAYGEIDIALDTFPYNGTTTTCEALWMGVPVVTLKGDMHVARVGATLLASVGLAELAAGSPQEYVQTAVALARDTARRSALRSGMRERLAASPLLDHVGFTRRLEGAYRHAWKTWCASGAAGTSAS